MSDAERHKAALREWLETAVNEGWLDGGEIPALDELEAHGADRLFQTGSARPLTVGLFGGTGVGKSSLLNRLVGEDVARVGLERPTSTEVTLYIHEQYPLNDLEGLLPVERVRVLTHRRDRYRDVVWIDMPDIDSVELANRELVLEWLPYIDWLIYVVSPERYRDDAGWRVLKQRGHRHHWLFVMNRWDAGTAEQLADFSRILAAEGFNESLLIKTSCTEPEDDDFESMSGLIDNAVAEHGLAGLQEIGERARLGDLQRRCEHYAGALGSAVQWRGFIETGGATLGEKLSALNHYLVDEAAIEAAYVAGRSSGERERAASAPARPRLVAEYVQDIESAMEVARRDLPAGPVRERTRAVLASLDRRVSDAITGGFREGTARPGNALQRGAAAVTGRLVYVLPLLACLGIAYVVVTRYQQGLSGAGGFLGFDFLAHSLMVLGLAALAPYLLSRVLRPSVRRSIIKRVDAALARTRLEVMREWQAAMNEAFERRRELDGSLGTIREAIERDL